MTNELLLTLSPEALTILVKARQLEKWVTMEQLTIFGMNRDLLHALEDMGLIIVNGHNKNPMIKLSLRGITAAQDLI